MSEIKDISGKIFGRWSVLSYFGKRGQAHYWLCRCSCKDKTEKPVRADQLKDGSSQSCGCYHREVKTTHGLFGTRTYNIYRTMLARIHNPKAASYPDYGGRGIKICERWEVSFENFLEDMGKCPPKMTIERKDNNGDYTPANCVWETLKAQANNRRGNNIYTYQGKSLTVSQWADEVGLNYFTLWSRLEDHKWPIDRALTTPARSIKKQNEKKIP